MATTLKHKNKRRNPKDKLYHYIESGLTNVYLDGGVTTETTPYGPAVSIANLDDLQRCIARCLVKKPGPLTGSEFRFLRIELGFSQRMMAQLCGREERIVRTWESKEDDVGEPANTIVRFVYTQRYEPTAKYEELSRGIAALQKMDRDYFEMRLTPTKDGWCPQPQAA
jgi:putative transcriptional regulator